MKLIKNVFSITLLTLLGMSLVAVPVAEASSQVRDNDTNAIIYGGAYSVKELKQKLNDGADGPHQSAAQLTDLFAKNGIYEKDFGQLVDGYVTDDNKVIVDGKVVKSDVTTMGRHDIKGSKRDTRFSYPIYLRHPSVSFLSKKLPAFVSMNYDHTYAYAILKPCGNIVKGPGVKHKAVPKPPVVKPKPKPPVVVPVPTPKPIVRTVEVEKVVPVVQKETVYVTKSVSKGNMPTSGPAEAAAGAMGLTSVGGAVFAWIRSKKGLLSAIAKIK